MGKRYVLFAAILFAASAGAQEPQMANVKGRLHSETDRILYGYVIELEQLGSHGEIVRADVESDGDFGFRNIPVGEYVLRITNFHGEAISQQFVSIHEKTASVDVRLPASPPKPTGATISLAELRHPPARKAVDACAAAQRFSESGHYDRAAGELEKAVRISPDFAPAHSNLGVQYLRMRRYDEARTEIQRSLEIVGPNPRDLANLSFAMAGLWRLPEAIESAKGALRLDRENAAAHYVLGSLLALDRETRGEGRAHLEVAAKTLASAREALERLGQ